MGGTAGSAEPLGIGLGKGVLSDRAGTAVKAGVSTALEAGISTPEVELPTPRRRASEKLEKPVAEEVGREGESAIKGESDPRGRGEGLGLEF